MKSRKLNLQDVLCILSQIFFALCGGALEFELFENSQYSVSNCNFFYLLILFLFLSSPLQPVTWAVIVVRSQTCWIKAFRSARSVSSSQPTTASSFCAASGTRASGFTPPTQVLYNHRTVAYDHNHKKLFPQPLEHSI